MELELNYHEVAYNFEFHTEKKKKSKITTFDSKHYLKENAVCF